VPVDARRALATGWLALAIGALLASGLFSILLDPALAAARVDAFCDALKLFKLGYSWGGPVSLVVPYDLRMLRGERTRLSGHLVRFSIGLEASDDLIGDLDQALHLLR